MILKMYKQKIKNKQKTKNKNNQKGDKENTILQW